MCCIKTWHLHARVFAELEVARLSTDGNLADLTFPQSEQHGNSIQLSASTLKQHGKNGRGQNSHLFFFFSSRSLQDPQLSDLCFSSRGTAVQAPFFFPLQISHPPFISVIMLYAGNYWEQQSHISPHRWDQDGVCAVQKLGLLPAHRERQRPTGRRGGLSELLGHCQLPGDHGFHQQGEQ